MEQAWLHADDADTMETWESSNYFEVGLNLTLLKRFKKKSFAKLLFHDLSVLI